MENWLAAVGAVGCFIGLVVGYLVGYRAGAVSGELSAIKSHRARRAHHEATRRPPLDDRKL